VHKKGLEKDMGILIRLRRLRDGDYLSDAVIEAMRENLQSERGRKLFDAILRPDETAPEELKSQLDAIDRVAAAQLDA